MTVSKLAHYRRLKGLSQEQLAAASGVSARTIQRIENGKVDAHLATLKMLADALDVETYRLTESLLILGDQQKVKADRLKVLFHLLALIGLAFPILNILLPTALWFLKKEESPVYDSDGKLTVNFQLTMSIAFVPSFFLMVFLFPVGFPLVILVYFYTLVMCLVNIFRSINHQKVLYPLTYAFIK